MRKCRSRSSGDPLRCIDEVNGVPDRQDRFNSIIIDADVEGFLNRHQEFNLIEAVESQVINEIAVSGDCGRFNCGYFIQKLFEVVERCHSLSSPATDENQYGLWMMRRKERLHGQKWCKPE